LKVESYLLSSVSVLNEKVERISPIHECTAKLGAPYPAIIQSQRQRVTAKTSYTFV